MAAMRWLITGLFIAVYGSLLIMVGIADSRALAFNNPDSDNYKLRSGYNPLFHPGEYNTPSNLPPLFPPNAYQALAQQAATDGKMDQAKQHAYDALKRNPANGAISLMLFEFYARPNLYRVILPPPGDITSPPTPINRLAYAALSGQDKQIAEILANYVDRLRPTYTIAQGSLSSYWTAQKKPEKAIKGWSVLMSFSLDSSQKIFPLLHAAMDKPAMKEIIQQYMQDPPSWWKYFFNYLLAHEKKPEKIQAFYQKTNKTAFFIDSYARDAYVNYLIKQQHWSQARQVWSASLDNDTEASKLLYDGGFESASSPNGEFAWKIKQVVGTTLRADYTNGVTGKQALRVAFRGGKSIAFAHVWQTLILAPGKYTLTGRYRADQLNTIKGLRWRMRCMDKQSTLLAESEAFKGYSDWSTFKFDLNIPEGGCSPQMLRLESDSTYAHENVFEGELWFDDFSLLVTP